MIKQANSHFSSNQGLGSFLVWFDRNRDTFTSFQSNSACQSRGNSLNANGQTLLLLCFLGVEVLNSLLGRGQININEARLVKLWLKGWRRQILFLSKQISNEWLHKVMRHLGKRSQHIWRGNFVYSSNVIQSSISITIKVVLLRGRHNEANEFINIDSTRVVSINWFEEGAKFIVSNITTQVIEGLP